MRRDRAAEFRWLVDLRIHAERQGLEHPAPSDFEAGVLARLDQGGPDIAVQSAGRYVRELEEEALDLAGWALLTHEAHSRAPRVLRATLRDVAAYGYAAHGLLAGLEGEGR